MQVTLNPIFGTEINNRIYSDDDTDDIVYARGGDDLIYSSFGTDFYLGGLGDDTVSFFRSTGVVGDLNTGKFLSDGNKTLVDIENIHGSKYSDTIIGNVADNYINGDFGLDLLFGGAGDDTLRAGGGRYRDILMGGSSDDELYDNTSYGGAVASYQLARSAVYVNTDLGISRGGDGNDKLHGIGEVIGSTHGDTLVAGTHRGIMWGGSGEDILSVASTRSISTSLYGENDNDTIYGGRGGLTHMDGGRGVDFLYGGLGSTKMFGGIGTDTLVAGDRTDTMSGGSGGDRFVFLTAGDIDYGRSTYDNITDFSRSEKDKIDVASIDANPFVPNDQKFSFIGAGQFTAVGQLSFERYSGSAGSGTWVNLNIDRDSSTDVRFFLSNQSSMSASDFFL